MTKEQHAKFSKAVKEGKLSQKQHDKLPPKLLEAILKSKNSKKVTKSKPKKKTKK